MIRINLAPVRARRRAPGVALKLPSLNLGLVFGVVYVLAILGLGAYWWTLRNQEAKLAADVDTASKELATLKAKIGQGSRVKDQVAELRKRVQVIEELTKNQARPIMLLDAFADVMPRDLWITLLEDRGADLHITGTAFSTTAVSDFMSNLRTSGKFKDVDLIISRQDISKIPSLVTFEVTCRFES